MSQPIFLIVKILAAGVLGFWLYRDSRGRDYTWMVWTFLPAIVLFTDITLSVFFLIIILAIYLLTRPKGGMITCPHCNKRIHEILFVCPFCKRNAKHECLNCHEPVPWTAEQCPYCRSRSITKE